MAFDEMAERFHKIISKIEGILLTLVAKTQRRSKPAHHQLAGHQSAQNRIAIVEPCIEAIICALLAAREILPKEMLPVVACRLSLGIAGIARFDLLRQPLKTQRTVDIEVPQIRGLRAYSGAHYLCPQIAREIRIP